MKETYVKLTDKASEIKNFVDLVKKKSEKSDNIDKKITRFNSFTYSPSKSKFIAYNITE